ncbi:MAG: DNA repair protein RecN [Bacteroidales bacterium]|nr:DNA repair protein RecN [Bacteroidales bacterium]
MFTHLSIRNYVLIQELEVDFYEGLSIITGETGAGKSILLGALGLLTGQRADSGALLDKTRKCVVEGVFHLQSPTWKPTFDEYELEYAEETVIRREVSAEGKSRAFVNDSPVNLSILKDLGAKLVDIHSQHQNIYLESPVFQMQVLDTYARQSDTVADYTCEYGKYSDFEERLNCLIESTKQQQSEADYHRFRFEELTAAKLSAEEQAALEEEQELLTHAGEVKTGLSQISAWIDGDEASAVQMLKSAISMMSRLQQVYSKAKTFLPRMETTLIELKDIASETEQLTEMMEFQPERLEQVNDRLDLLYSLQQKHHAASVEELIAIRDGLGAKLRELNNYDAQISRMKQQLTQMQTRLSALAGEISAKRHAAVQGIEKHIHTLLQQLGIPNALFRADITPTEQLTPTGADHVRFLFSANRQQNLQELGKVASGGELSRIMLAIKAVIAEKITLPTLIFDEIDAGVSGEIAEKMGNIIERTAHHAQVVNITHLPQVAAKGQHHYKVYKRDTGQTTQTKMQKLTPEERVMEIARILSGEKVTEAAMENARQLLKYK